MAASSSSSNVVDSNPRPATPARLSVTPPGALAPSCRDPIALQLASYSRARPPTTTPAAAATGSHKQAGGSSAIRLSKGGRHSSLGTRGTAGGSAGPVRLGRAPG